MASNRRSGSKNEPSQTENRTSSNQISINNQKDVYSVAFLADGQLVSGDVEGNIRHWRVEDGLERGTMITAGSPVFDIAVSRDGEGIVSGTKDGRVTLWKAAEGIKVVEINEAHKGWVHAVDISPGGKEIASGGGDGSVCIWSASTGERVYGPWVHRNNVAAVKFSPDGRLVATATWLHDSVQLYNLHNDHLPINFPVKVSSPYNATLAWASDSERLFALSILGDIYCLGPSIEKPLSQWRVAHDDKSYPDCIALACNDSFILTSARQSISIWDTATHEQISFFVIQGSPRRTLSLANSLDYHIATGARDKITLTSLGNILPSPYSDLIRIIQSNSLDYDRIDTIVQSLSQISERISRDLRDNQSIIYLLAEATHKCVSKLQMIGDERSKVGNHEEAVRAYFAALSLSPSLQDCDSVLMRWTRIMLHCSSPDKILDAANNFKLPGFHVYRAICNALKDENRITEAIDFFKQIPSEDPEEAKSQCDRAQWGSDFQQRCMERLGDVERDFNNYDHAIERYSSALSLETIDDKYVNGIILKCCEARAGLLKNELVHATKDIEANPLSYEGYRRKYAALHCMGHHSEAFQAFKIMLSKIENSLDPEIRKLLSRYIDVTPVIRRVINQTIRDIPHVLVNVTTGRLCNRLLQVCSFESLPVFEELRSSMTTPDQLDYARIRREVETFYEYVMFSHNWQPPEPLFHMLENSSIDELPESPGNNKLRGFRDIARSRHFQWCWSDTCCINKADVRTVWESITSMFQWYRLSALTVIHLLGVLSQSRESDCLYRSIWNTRMWTYPEYVASPVVQFYTEDWKPYLGLDMFNHKESPIILSEMSKAMAFPTWELAMLQPGLDSVREKLYIASKRQTTRVEDAAYSLFGLLGVILPISYGEGNKAVGRLLEHILAHSSNITILAWTGTSGSHHSYLPSDLTVYNELSPPHLPRFIEMDNMDRMVTTLQSSSLDLSHAVELYERLINHAPVSLVDRRLKLPVLCFPLQATDLVSFRKPDSDPTPAVYHASTPVFGDIQMYTRDNLSGMDHLALVHPWISHLVDQDFCSTIPLFDLDTRALQLVIRLMQPFGALLLAPSGDGQYRRVATDCFINVQIRAETTMKELLDSIRTVDMQ